MSKSDILLSKFRTISVLVSILSFAFFVVALLFAVVSGSINCVNQPNLCSVDSGYKSIIVTLFILFLVFLVVGRVIDMLLQKESKLVDVSAYRESLRKEEEVAFSQTQIYSDILKTKKPKTSEALLDSDEEDGVLEESTDIDKPVGFMDKVKAINSKAIDKIKAVNWKFWEDSKAENIDEDEDTEKESKPSFMDKVKSINWMFWKNENSEKKLVFDDDFYEDEENNDESKESIKIGDSETADLSEKTKPIEESEVKESRIESAVQIRLNKGELVKIIAEDTSLSKEKAKLVLNTTLKIIEEQVHADDEVKIGKFGRFKKMFVKANTEIDPNTGKETQIKEGYTVLFYADKAFKDIFEQEDEKQIVVEPVVEEQVIKEPIVEEPVVKKVEEKPVLEKVKEEPVVEKVKEEPKVEKVAPTTVPEVEKKVEVKKAKPKKVSVVTKTKADFIQIISASGVISKNKSNKFLGTFGKVIIEQLAKGEDVELEGLGTMTTILMPSKEAVNPQTKQRIIVPAHHQVRMRFSEEYKREFE